MSYLILLTFIFMNESFLVIFLTFFLLFISLNFFLVIGFLFFFMFFEMSMIPVIFLTLIYGVQIEKINSIF